MNFAAVGAQTIFVAGSSHITFLIPIAFDDSINAGNHHVMPDIELSFVVKQWLFNIRLHNVCSVGPIWVHLLFFQDRLNLLQVQAHADSVSSV